MGYEQAALADHKHHWRLAGADVHATYTCVDCDLTGNRAMWARIEALEALARQAAKGETREGECCHCWMSYQYPYPHHEPECIVLKARALVGGVAPT